MSVTYLPSALRSSTFDPTARNGDSLSGQTLGAGADIGWTTRRPVDDAGGGAGPVDDSTEHVFEVCADTPSAARPPGLSRLAALRAPSDAGVPAEAPLGRHVHVDADRLPHRARRLAVRQRLHHGAVAQRAEHVVASEGPGIRRAELVVHQGPEVADPHPSSLPPGGPEPFPAERSSERCRIRPRTSGSAGIV